MVYCLVSIDMIRYNCYFLFHVSKLSYHMT